MNNNYFISVFGTFGSPNGFNQSFLFLEDKTIAQSIKKFDLNTNAIMLFPNTKLYSIRKDNIGANKIISYTIYTYAKEPNSDRSGSFIGSGLSFINQITEESISINLLNDFHQNLIEKNLNNETLVVNHSKDFSVTQPKDFDKINYNLKTVDSVNFNQNSNKILVVYCLTSLNQLQLYFKKSLDLLSEYDTIYFTQDKEIAEYVNSKKIFEITDEEGFKKIIDEVKEKRNQEILSKINDLQQAKNSLEVDRKALVEKLKIQIEQNELKQKENEKVIQDSKTDLNTINQKYSIFSSKIDELVHLLQKNEQLETVQQLYVENKNIFLKSIQNKDELQLISSLKKPEVSSNFNLPKKENNNSTLYHFNENKTQSQHQPKNSNSSIFKILSLFFGLIIVGLLVTYFFILPKTNPIPTPPIAETAITLDSLQNINKLNPLPNSEIDSVELKKINLKLVKNSKIDSVANFIFKANPSSITEFYKYQKTDYKTFLYEKNNSSFNIENQDTIFVNSLKIIPNYKE